MKNCSLLISTKDGQQIQVESANIVNTTENNFENENSFIKVKKHSCDFDVEINKISKKRFIKLLMAKGIQKNTATKIAKYVLKKYGYYTQIFLLLF